MMTPDQQDRLEELLVELCDGQLSDEQCRELDAMLRQDPEARRFYTQYMDMHARLLVRSELPGLELRPAHTTDRYGAVNAHVGWHSARRVAGYAMVAMLTFVATLGFYQWYGGATPGSADGPVVEIRYVSSDYVATIVRAEGCRWEGGLMPEGERLAAGPLRLLEGVAVLRFDAGVSLAVVGPAEFMIESVDAVLLRRGEAVVQGDGGFTGFALRTGAADFIDWGAEYGVMVDAGTGETALHVHAGKVEVLDARRDSTFVEAGQGLRYDRDGASTPQTATAQGSRFGELMRLASDPRDTGRLLVHDSFDYPSVRSTEVDGGIGWTGRWYRAGFGSSLPVFVEPGNNLQGPRPLRRSTGGLLRLPSFGATVYKRQLADPIDLHSDDIRYVSFLLRGDASPDAEGNWTTFKLTSRENKRNQLMFGVNPHGDLRVFIRGGGHSTGDQRIEPNKTYLFVAKLVTSATGHEQVFVKVFGPGDTLDLREPTEWMLVSRPALLEGRFDEVHIAWHENREMRLDEVRIGTTWASVVPVDEASDKVALSTSWQAPLRTDHDPIFTGVTP